MGLPCGVQPNAVRQADSFSKQRVQLVEEQGALDARVRKIKRENDLLREVRTLAAAERPTACCPCTHTQSLWNGARG